MLTAQKKLEIIFAASKDGKTIRILGGSKAIDVKPELVGETFTVFNNTLFFKDLNVNRCRIQGFMK